MADTPMADTKLKIVADFEFTMNQKRAVQDKAKELVGERRKFGELWRDFLDGDADAEQVFVWWWAHQDGNPDLTLDEVGEWGPNDYEVVVPGGAESEGEGSAAESGGSNSPAKSRRSASSTAGSPRSSTTSTPTS